MAVACSPVSAVFGTDPMRVLGDERWLWTKDQPEAGNPLVIHDLDDFGVPPFEETSRKKNLEDDPT